MKRWMTISGLIASLAFAAAGCSSGPDDDGGSGGETPQSGGISLKKYPVAGDWDPVGTPVRYPAGAAELDIYAGENISAQLRANLLDSLLVKQYAHHDWEKAVDKDGKSKPDLRRIRVELYIHPASINAGKTFQQWHRGTSITDLGEKAVAEEDAIIFLRGSIVCRLVPLKWPPKTAGDSTIKVGKAIDAWLQGK
ncbi:MAG: hypothetical protein AAB074_19375 [Planctomycetota bacterium]